MDQYQSSNQSKITPDVIVNDLLFYAYNEGDRSTRHDMEKRMIESYSEEEVTTSKKILILECGKIGLTKKVAESTKQRMRPNILQKNA